MSVHAVILAGGSGTRLWPASRRSWPKQLLPITQDGEALILRAVDLARRVAGARVTIVTAAEQAAATRTVVPDVEILAEPVARNTAAAIGLAGAVLAERDPDAKLVILPADHHIRDQGAMTTALDDCLDAVAKADVIALVGILPTRPDTGFGYLEMEDGPGLRPVLRFVEKPDAVRAHEYFASGRHLWNAGIFCLTARRLLEELDRHLPTTAEALRKSARDGNHGLYAALPSISFDHGVMERADRVVAIPADVGWNDVGSWSALGEVRGVDEEGNTIVGQGIVIDGSDNVVLSDDGTLVAAIGVSDLVIIKHGNAILVVRKDQAQRVREVITALEARQMECYL